MAGGAAEVRPVSLSCPLSLLRTHSSSLLVCCIFVFAGMGATSAASRWLEVNLFLYEKRGLIPTAEMDALCAFLCSGRPCPSPEAGQTGGHEACGPPGSH